MLSSIDQQIRSVIQLINVINDSNGFPKQCLHYGVLITLYVTNIDCRPTKCWRAYDWQALCASHVFFMSSQYGLSVNRMLLITPNDILRDQFVFAFQRCITMLQKHMCVFLWLLANTCKTNESSGAPMTNIVKPMPQRRKPWGPSHRGPSHKCPSRRDPSNKTFHKGRMSDCSSLGKCQCNPNSPNSWGFTNNIKCVKVSVVKRQILQPCYSIHLFVIHYIIHANYPFMMRAGGPRTMIFVWLPLAWAPMAWTPMALPFIFAPHGSP